MCSSLLAKPDNMSLEAAKLHLEKLEDLLSKPGNVVIYGLGDWLAALGLKLTVTVDKDSEECEGTVDEVSGLE